MALFQKKNMKKKVITFVINSLEVGGTEKQLLQLIKEIKEKYKVKLLCFKKGKLHKYFLKEKVEVFSLSKGLFSFIFLIKFLIKNKTDIYHFFLPKSYILCSLILIFSKVKKIMSRRSLNNYHKKYWYLSLLLEKLLHKKTDLILVNSKEIKKQLVETEKVNQKKILTIENFNLSQISSPKSYNKIPKKKKNEVFFIYVANFIPYKGHLDLLKICSEIVTQRKWKLFLVGEDRENYKEELVKYISISKIKNNIIFFEPTLGIHNFYKAVDFAVSTSKEEGSSNFLLESISFGLPIISYDVGGNKKFHNGKNGFLIKCGDDFKFKAKIQKLIDLNNRKDFEKNSFLIFRKRKKNRELFKIYEKLYDL